MITTRRSSEFNSYTIGENKGFASVDLLERKTPDTYNEYIANPVNTEEDYLQAKERMQRNLDKLLNYDRYAEISAEETQVETEEVVQEVSSMQDEDIMPSPTTMQFGDDNFDNVIQDLKAQQESVVTSSPKRASKGKLVAILYALAVTVVLALIIINTGVLSRLESANTAKTEALNEKIEQYRVLNEEIDGISSNEYIEDFVKNEYGMVKK